MPVHLDPRLMRKDGDRYVLDCPECGHSFSVRLSDPYLPVTPAMVAARAGRAGKGRRKGGAAGDDRRSRLRRFLVGS